MRANQAIAIADLRVRHISMIYDATCADLHDQGAFDVEEHFLRAHVEHLQEELGALHPALDRPVAALVALLIATERYVAARAFLRRLVAHRSHHGHPRLMEATRLLASVTGREDPRFPVGDGR